MAASIRGRSCITTRPAPILRCPTSEFPIWPSGKPTSSPEVFRKACGQDAQSASKLGVLAWRTALSAMSSRQPQPSRITSITGRGGAAACMRNNSSTYAGRNTPRGAQHASADQKGSSAGTPKKRAWKCSTTAQPINASTGASQPISPNTSRFRPANMAPKGRMEVSARSFAAASGLRAASLRSMEGMPRKALRAKVPKKIRLATSPLPITCTKAQSAKDQSMGWRVMR